MFVLFCYFLKYNFILFLGINVYQIIIPHICAYNETDFIIIFNQTYNLNQKEYLKNCIYYFCYFIEV